MSTDLAQEHPGCSGEAAGGLPRRGGQVQSAASRRPAAGTVQSQAGRATGPDVRTHEPDPVRRHERPARERLHQRQEHVVRDRRRHRDRRQTGQRRHRGPGRSLRRLEPVREGRHAEVHVQLPRASSVSRHTATSKLPKGKSTVKMDFAYDGGRSPARAVPRRCTSTASRWVRPRSSNRVCGLLGRRDRRRRRRHGDARVGGLRSREQPVHRQDRQGHHQPEITAKGCVRRTKPTDTSCSRQKSVLIFNRERRLACFSPSVLSNLPHFYLRFTLIMRLVFFAPYAIV